MKDVKGFSTVVQEGKRYQPCYALFKDGEEVYRGGTAKDCSDFLKAYLLSLKWWIWEVLHTHYTIEQITP